MTDSPTPRLERRQSDAADPQHAHPVHGDHAQHSPQHPAGGHGHHDHHEGHDPAAFRRKFWLSFLLTVVILAFDEHFLGLLGLSPLAVPFAAWVPPVFGAILYVYGGMPFLTGAVSELRMRRPGMMMLITLGISVAFFYSVAVTLGLISGMAIWWELATLVTVMLLGHWVEMASVEGASRALDELAALVPETAHRVIEGGTEEVQVTTLQLGERILIRPGGQIPVDGEVVDGASSVNEAFLTGESRPVPKQEEDDVVAGAVNGEGALIVRVTRTGGDTTLSQIQRLVAEAQASRGQYQNLADRAAGWLFYIALGAGIITFIAWLAFGQTLDFAVVRTVTVLVMACPHALGLAVPLVIVNATSLAARNGMLVRNREAFERARDLQTVAFDKTGTLTEGRHVLQHVTATARDDDEALRLAAALEARSEHPLAKAIMEAARERDLDIPEVKDFQAVAGKGVMGMVDGRWYRVGRLDWAASEDAALPDEIGNILQEAEGRGESTIALAEEQAVIAVFTFADQVRPSAREAVARLKASAVESVMITGDAEAVASTVAAELGIDRYHARVLPGDKAELVRNLKEQGPTAFVGDGINDAPALVEADLGIAIGVGTNVAIESADLVLVENDPLTVVQARRLSEVTYRKMIQNLLWATGYNVVALPLAAGVLYGVGILLTPAVGAIFMSASTIIVAVNAVLLRRESLDEA